MTSGVSVAAAGALVIALLLGPKVGEAVAAPMVTAARPVVAHVVTALPTRVVSKMIGVDTRVVVPAPKAPETNIQLQRKVAAPVPAPLPKPQAHLALLQSSDVAVNTMAVSVMEINLQTTEGSTAPKGMAYLDGMRDAGYPLDLNNDLNTLVSLKSLGVTPEYAKSDARVCCGSEAERDRAEGLSRGGDREVIRRHTRVCGGDEAEGIWRSERARVDHDEIAGGNTGIRRGDEAEGIWQSERTRANQLKGPRDDAGVRRVAKAAVSAGDDGGIETSRNLPSG
jgi:hypothetical protein